MKVFYFSLENSFSVCFWFRFNLEMRWFSVGIQIPLSLLPPSQWAGRDCQYKTKNIKKKRRRRMKIFTLSVAPISVHPDFFWWGAAAEKIEAENQTPLLWKGKLNQIYYGKFQQHGTTWNSFAKFLIDEDNHRVKPQQKPKLVTHCTSNLFKVQIETFVQWWNFGLKI